MNNTQKRTLRRIIIEAALLLLLLPLQSPRGGVQMHSRAARRGPHLGRGHGRAVHHHPYARGRRPPPPRRTRCRSKRQRHGQLYGADLYRPRRLPLHGASVRGRHGAHDLRRHGVHGDGAGDQPAERRQGRDLGHGRQQRKDRPAAVPEPVRPARRADAHACPGQNHPGPRAPRAQARPAPNRRPHAGDPAGRAGRCSLPVG